jgi:hypothetical protein
LVIPLVLIEVPLSICRRIDLQLPYKVEAEADIVERLGYKKGHKRIDKKIGSEESIQYIWSLDPVQCRRRFAKDQFFLRVQIRQRNK